MFLELLEQGKVQEALGLVNRKPDVENYVKEYNGDRTIRPTQVGFLPDKTDSEGNKKEANKIIMAIQNMIVDIANSFIFGKPVKITQKSDDSTTDQDRMWFDEVMELWKENRLDDTFQKFGKAVKSETESAIVLYTKGEGDELKVRTRLITSDNGICRPAINAFGDMEGFVWEFLATEGGKEVKRYYVWTDDMEYVYNENFEQISKKTNPFEKIPVIYQSQKYPEWWIVRFLIDRYEVCVSKLSSTNDKYAQPKYVATGKVEKSLADSDIIELQALYDEESGKFIQSSLDVISWNESPLSTKLELETLFKSILQQSSTPDLFSDKVSGNMANYAMELMFLSPILKAGSSIPDFEKSISRCFNLLKRGVIIKNKTKEHEIENIKANIDFTSVLPKNKKEIIEMLSEATGGKDSMSQLTTVKSNPFVRDANAEIEQMKAETKTATEQVGETYNP